MNETKEKLIELLKKHGIATSEEAEKLANGILSGRIKPTGATTNEQIPTFSELKELKGKTLKEAIEKEEKKEE